MDDEIQEFQPFDPEKISIDTKPITMDTCLRRLEQGTIILNPDFQREEVWTIEKKCRLIESLMLKIPIPMFYVASDEKGIFNVVDGLQRLSTIRSFVLGDDYFFKGRHSENRGNGFRLQDLEFWGDKYNGATFSRLPIVIQNRILETGFTFTIINPGTPEEVKRNIFKRINTGGEPLTLQEIRHALYVGQSTKLLLKLSKKTEFLQTTGETVKSNRMMDRELILRFLAFSLRSYKKYPKNGDMDSFLSITMQIINILPDFKDKTSNKIFKDGIEREDVLITDITFLEQNFVKAMKRSELIFGEHAFRKSIPRERKVPINKGLFEVWGNLLANLTDKEFNKFFNLKEEFMEKYQRTLKDEKFIRIISKDSLKSSSVKERFENLYELLGKFL